METNVGIIAQARINSSRFYAKIFQKVDNKKTAIELFLDSCFKSKLVTSVVLAVPEDQKSHFNFLLKKFPNLVLFGGSEEDVLKRYYEAAHFYNLDIIVRLTTDCFLIQPEIIDDAISKFKRLDFDLVTNYTLDATSIENPDTYESQTSTPDGFCVEVFNVSSLNDAYEHSKKKYDREHVTPWIKRNKNCSLISTGRLVVCGKFSVDTPDDLVDAKHLMSLIKSGKIKIDV
jgi:spore coat polysaccharide biosynthesis protein SpsF (cytidylyltransferase family)